MRRRKGKPTGHEPSGAAQQTAPIPSRNVAWDGGRLAGSEATKERARRPAAAWRPRIRGVCIRAGRERQSRARTATSQPPSIWRFLPNRKRIWRIRVNGRTARKAQKASTAKKKRPRGEKPQKRETVRKLHLRKAHSTGSIDALKTTHAVVTRYAEKTFGENLPETGGQRTTQGNQGRAPKGRFVLLPAAALL